MNYTCRQGLHLQKLASFPPHCLSLVVFACSTITASDKRWGEKVWERGYPELPALGYLSVYQFGFHSSNYVQCMYSNKGLLSAKIVQTAVKLHACGKKLQFHSCSNWKVVV